MGMYMQQILIGTPQPTKFANWLYAVNMYSSSVIAQVLVKLCWNEAVLFTMTDKFKLCICIRICVNHKSATKTFKMHQLGFWQTFFRVNTDF